MVGPYSCKCMHKYNPYTKLLYMALEDLVFSANVMDYFYCQFLELRTVTIHFTQEKQHGHYMIIKSFDVSQKKKNVFCLT